MVRAYMTLRAVGAIVDPIDIVCSELARRTSPGSRVVSLGSGRGHNERRFASHLRDREFVCIDVAEQVVERAREAAQREGLENLRFQVGDFNELELEPDSCDAIVCIAAIHHVEALERFWNACRLALRRGGAVLAQEYIGPSRMQWTDAQVVHGTRVLGELVPDEHRTGGGRVERPPLDVMLREDPSEAVRSSEIMATCAVAGFTIDAYAGAGGGLLQPVLMHRIDTFDPRNWRNNRVLAGLFEEEDRLMGEGVLGDDFAMFAARPGRGS